MSERASKVQLQLLNLQLLRISVLVSWAEQRVVPDKKSSAKFAELSLKHQKKPIQIIKRDADLLSCASACKV